MADAPVDATSIDIGDAGFDTLAGAVYDELRALSERLLWRERPGHTLQPTALVHEAYLRLAQQRARYSNRAHFLANAARMMRRILIDHARARLAAIHGGGRLQQLSAVDAVGATNSSHVDLLALDDAMERLALIDPRRSRVVELRFFGGLTLDETAEVLGLSKWTIVDDWRLARAWLHRELSRGCAP